MSEDETLIDFRGVKIVPEEAKLIEEMEEDLGEKLSIQPISSDKGALILVESGHVIQIELWKSKFMHRHTHIFKFPRLEKLHIMETEIPEISAEVSNLIHLKRFILDNSNTTSIQANLNKLTNLEKFFLSQGHINRVPLFPSQIRRITLKNVGLVNFPNELKACNSLWELNLSGNNISTIPDWFVENKNILRELNLSNTKIWAIPEWISEFHELIHLIFENAPIKKICDLTPMKNLTRFNVKGSKLIAFPSSLASLEELYVLKLGAVGYPKVPDIFGNKPNLEILHLNGFDLNDFPNNIKNCSILREINFDNCRLEEAEPDFYGIENLETISLVGCNLVEPHKSFIYKPKDSLDLRQNQIEKLYDRWLRHAHKMIVDKSSWKNPERPLDLNDDDYLVMLAALKGILYRDSRGDLNKKSLSNIQDQLDVDFSDENVEFESDGETYPPEIMGLQHLPDGRAFIGMYAGGDWEYPVYLYIFRVGDEIYARTPHSSNTYNADTGRSFGHEDDQDEEGYEDYDEPYEMNAKLVLAEIKREMDEVEKITK